MDIYVCDYYSNFVLFLYHSDADNIGMRFVIVQQRLFFSRYKYRLSCSLHPPPSGTHQNAWDL